MKFQAIGLSLVVVFASSSAMADVYKCTVNGRTTYTDLPCATEAAAEVVVHMDNKLAISTDPQDGSLVTRYSSSSTKGKGRERRKLSEDVSEQLKESCLDKWRSQLKDPRSPYIVSAQLDEVTNLEHPDAPVHQEVVMDVRAKNSFGAYIPDTFVCGIGNDGLADEKLTKVQKALHLVGIEHDVGDRHVE